MASKPWTGAEIDRAKRMYADGKGVFDIGQAIGGRSKDSVLRVLRIHGVKIRKQGGPANNDPRECLSFRMMREDAMIGSAQLLAAIQRAGVRP